MRGTARRSVRLGLAFFLIFLAGSQSAAQETPYDDPVQFVGMTIPALLQALGPPKTVYAARGSEDWQDDVVFAYDRGEFYLFKDRVWQASLKSAFGIQVGDPKAAALLVLGEDAQAEGNSVSREVPGFGWNLKLRVDFNGAGKTAAIFLYRPDY